MAEAGTHSAGVLRELLAVFSFGVDLKALKEGEAGLGHFFDLDFHDVSREIKLKNPVQIRSHVTMSVIG